ncbi:MAG: serine--tRNA ligase [Actinomycetota bacterium]|nr:serine--tRNA ligase [Actinomycetota bacterium]
MIDIRLAREHGEELRRSLARKGAAGLFDDLIDADSKWRSATARVDELRSRGRLKGRPSASQLAELKDIKAELKEAEAELDRAVSVRSELLTRIPNPPADDTPDGTSDEDALELRRVGELPVFDFLPRDHVELGGFDLDRGSRLAGSRFTYRRGATAMLELSMYRYALERLVEKGFEVLLPPVLVRQDAMYGTGFLPTEEANLYRVESDDLYLTGTSEVALAGFHQGEILDEDDLPRLYAAYSTCFRREAGAAGRDTRGIFRVHQFDKVEMFAYSLPGESADLHERLLGIEEELVQALGLSYRVVCTAAGDLGPSAAKKYDIEAWIPSQERYREITSCSNTTDYQARRLNVRYRSGGDGKGGGKLALVHTLNGTAMTARWLIALMETYQDSSGEVAVPEVLWSFGAPRRLPTNPG